MPPSLAHARPLFLAEMLQFGGAERSLLALSGWLYRQRLPHYLLTYIDHCNLAQYATHPVTIVELKPASGARHKITSLKRHFQERGPSPFSPLVSGYQPALHATLAGLRGFHCLMHDTPSLFVDATNQTLKSRLRMTVSNRIVA